MSEIMLKVEDIKKEYKLGQIGGATLREELQRVWAKARKKEDPTKKIGSQEFKKGERFMALDGVSFEVTKGERVGIVGHNGAGKSTLLKLISRITAPTDGTIYLNGRIASMLEVGTGFHPELTGRENVYMNGAILGMTKKEIDTKMDDIIDFSEVRQFIDTPVKRYSSGMYVKLAFSVSAHLDSEIMIMDEVLAVGDMAFQKKCLDKMNQVSRDYGRTILYVSHNMNTIRQLCNRVIVLDHGKKIFDGEVEKGVAKYFGMEERNNKHNVFPPEKAYSALTHYVKIEYLDLHNDYTDIPFGEKLHLSIGVASLERRKNVVIRFTIISNSDIPIASCFCKPMATEKDKKYRKDCELDTSGLAPGTYFIRIFVYEMDGSALIQDDFVSNALSFNVVSSRFWNGNVWGSVNFGIIED